MTNNKLLKLFEKLTEFTYIYGLEDKLMDIIKPILPKPLTKDEYGNYYIKIGESKTLFCSHLDTVGTQQLKINKVYFEKDGHRFVKTDEHTILGADDKTGMVIMLNMIDNDVPGMYYFLIGEEKGTVGSGLLFSRQSTRILSQFDRCIAFDRKAYGSIINRQMGKFCCSNEFVTALAAQLRANGMKYKKDPTGVWTDSALFMGTIPECTNLSVGYFEEHRKTEHQDLDYMLKLADTATKVKWEELPTVREPQPMDTEDPEELFDQPGQLPERKLYDIFDEVDTIIYNNTHQFASNCNFFKPEKEMTYFGVRDIKGADNFSAYIHMDGSITLVKGKIEINFVDIDMLKILNENDLLDEVLLFDENYDFRYEMRKGKRFLVYYHTKPKRLKKFNDFKNDKEV